MNPFRKYKAVDKLTADCKSFENADGIYDEQAAKQALLKFFGGYVKLTPDRNLKLVRFNSYYSFYINLIPLKNALKEEKYALACRELLILHQLEPILQQRIYNGLVWLYKEYLG